MELMFMVVGGGLIVGLAILFYQRSRRKKALKLVQINSQKVTDQIVAKSLVELGLLELPKLESALISDVWGKGVMAFEYQIEAQQLALTELTDLKTQLEAKMEQQALTQAISGPQAEQDQLFVVSDIWLKEGRLHVDVAYLVNKVTIDYVNDMHTLEKNN